MRQPKPTKGSCDTETTLGAKILDWSTSAKFRDPTEHNKMYSSDSGIPGTYVPNMSEEDQQKWKAKFIGKNNKGSRVEIRKSIRGVRLVIIVIGDHPSITEFGPRVKLSMNGALELTEVEWLEFLGAIKEAQDFLQKKHPERSLPKVAT